MRRALVRSRWPRPSARRLPQDPLPDTLTLYTMTVAPPARTAKLVDSDTSTPWPCRAAWRSPSAAGAAARATARADLHGGRPAIADVRPVFRSSGGYPTWVIVAKTAGVTQLQVADACAAQAFSLTVADDQL